MEFRYLTSLTDIAGQTWNDMVGIDYPFTRYEFLSALENSGSACTQTGWQPHHLTVYQQQQLIAVMPLYVKFHSYGEYIFDWAWADAYHKHGYEYYPKLLAAIPFTPATGPRLCIHPSLDRDDITQCVSDELIHHAKQINASSVHVLFHESDFNFPRELMPRSSLQFHWHNQVYQQFDDFLCTLSSRKRKAIKKERRAVVDSGITMQRLTGSAITEVIWRQFYHFYQITYAKRSGHTGYLTEAFFLQIAKSMPEQLLLVIAMKDQRIIAGAFYLFDSANLYGRYWGCSEQYEYLHFEACYYQGIEFCIERGLQRFDAGAQGEHKIQRGFKPVSTYSSHWIANIDFALAIKQFLQQETEGLNSYKQQCLAISPYKKP